MSLTPALRDARDEIETVARGFGLDFFETVFEMVDYDRINEIAAYGGFPTRYPHWRFGMEYEELSRSSEYGLSKIYEMVINTDPAYAYLLEGNSMVEQRTVIAHVFGHVDFFKNNYYFSVTDRKMVDRMANHATRVRELIDDVGLERVERFIDTCLSLDNLVDVHAAYMARAPLRVQQVEVPSLDRAIQVARLPARDYMEEFVNPPEFLEQKRRERVKQAEDRRRRFPEEPQRDVLGFLLHHAPLDGWEVEILQIIRDEALYFAPQGMTKIMNEGWASYWHSRILTERVLRADEFVDYADSYSRVMATSPRRLNPYKLGIELWRDIEERWNRGMFGPEWEDCDRIEQREAWDHKVGAGREKIFAVRRIYNDVTFLDEFLTPDFIERQRLFAFGYNPRNKQWEISSREFADVKQKLLDQITNAGQPVIDVVDANFRNRSELLLRHQFRGTPIRVDYANEVLANLHRVWRRPCHLHTEVDGKGRLLGFDGQNCTQEAFELPSSDEPR
jgi:stage V sporulation protein R